MILPTWIKPEVSFRSMKKLYHVRAIVDDVAVCRTWNANKRRWIYECLEPEWFHVFQPTQPD